MLSNTASLNGLKVLDLSRVLAGPYAAQILGDHGAQVTKVESFTGDDTRGYGPPFIDQDAAYFVGLNRNKLGVAIDLSTHQGREIIFSLIEKVDVIIENFKKSSWKKWGIDDFEIFRKNNPRLIHCRITGFGDTGDMGGLPGYDAAVQAMTGMMSINGAADADPTRLGIPIIDIGTGMQAVIGILMALNERNSSGHGQMLEVSLFNTALSILHPHCSNVLAGGVAKRTGNLHPNIYPYDSFETSDRSIYLAVGNDYQFKRLCIAINHPKLMEMSEFKRNADRVLNRNKLKHILDSELKKQSAEILSRRLLEEGIPCAPIYDVDTSLNLSQTKSQEMLIESEGYRGVGIPIKMKRTPGKFHLSPPKIGEHTISYLECMGWSRDQIIDLLNKNIIK